MMRETKKTGMTKRAALALLVCVAMFAAASCSKKAEEPTAPAEQGKKVIGVSLLKENDDFYKTLKKGLLETGESMGYEMVILSADTDEDKQDKNVDALLLKNPAAVVLCPVNSKGVHAIIKKMDAKGIPVFTADISAEKGGVVSHIASDNYMGGQIAAERMAELVGKGGLVTIIYQPGPESVAARVKGFVDKGSELGLEFVKDAAGQVMQYDGNDDQQKSEERAKTAIAGNAKLAGIFAANDNMAAGAEAAILGSKRTGIVLIGYDAAPMAQKKIDGGGVWKADVMQNPFDIGKITVETIDKHLKGEKVEPVVGVAVGLYDGAK